MSDETQRKTFAAAEGHADLTAAVVGALELAVRGWGARTRTLRARGALAASVRRLADTYTAIGSRLHALSRELAPTITTVGWTDQEGS